MMLKELQFVELEEALKMTKIFPDLLYVHNTIKVVLSQSLPQLSVSLFLYENLQGKGFWIIVRKSLQSMGFIGVCHKIKDQIDQEHINEAFSVLIEKFPDIFHSKEGFMFYGTESFYELFKTWFQGKRFPNCQTAKNKTHFYYMSESQQKQLIQLENMLPDGYFFDEVDFERDLERISSTWDYSFSEGMEVIKAKLSTLPYSLIREKSSGEAVAFEFVDPAHQFVFPEHRGRGLGNAVEVELCKKCIENEIVPYKEILADNKQVCEIARRSPYWTRWEDSYRNAMDLVFVICSIE